MSRYYRMLQKTRDTVVAPKNTAIDPMYSSGLKKRRNMRYIVAVFAPAAIVQISCSAAMYIMPVREKFHKPYTNWSAVLYLMFKMVQFCK